MEAQTETITIYRIKLGKHPQSFLELPADAKSHSIPLDGGKKIDVHLGSTQAQLPRWARLLRGHVPENDIGKVSTASALIIVEESDQYFALTFGQGRHYLADDSWDERFGLLVTLNSIDRKSIRSIDKRTFDAIGKISREQSREESEAKDFGLDVEQDLLRAVAGTPIDKSLGQRLYGKDSLKVNAKLTLEDIPTLVSHLSAKADIEDYQEDYPWVDQIAEVRSSSHIEELESVLISNIISGNTEQIWLAVPEILDWSRVGGFRYGRYPKKNLIHADLDLTQFMKEREGKINDIKDLKACKVHACNDDGDIVNKWSAFKCIYAEITLEQGTFVLNSGSWFHLNKDFVNDTNHRFRQIEESPLSFPEYNHRSESEYNEHVASADPEFILADKKLVRIGGGRSSIEFCDLFHRSKALVHVKRYGQSSVLSHLVAQGLISGEIFKTSAEFRKQALELLPNHRLIDDPTSPPKEQEYDVVYAIVSRKPPPLELPFFSKLNFVNATRTLRAFGFRPYINLIPMNTEFSVTKRGPKRRERADKRAG